MLCVFSFQLLSGRVPDGCASDSSAAGAAAADDSDPAEGSTPQEEIIIWKSRLQQAEEVNTQLRHDLSKAKQDCLQLQGVKVSTAPTRSQ